jgi:Cu+-exporting ATPase
MHREIAHTNQVFQRASNLSLYLMTALLGVIIAFDCWPVLAGWLREQGLAVPAGFREIGGYRIALLAAILGGARVLYGSLEGLLEGKLGADLALAIACIAAILIGEPLVAAEIVFIGMLGECLEGYTFERTQRAVQRIVEIFPQRCWVLREGQEVRVLTSELRVGDRVVVKPGGKVPVDGVVMEGRSAVDQSALTGESLPIDRGPGDEVLAGSLNQFGALTVEARRVAQETVAGRVIELTAKALQEKAPVQRTADRFARYFLPTVLGLAAATFLAALLGRWWTVRADYGGLTGADLTRCAYPALAVLVVACPCPLILATPAAIVAALGRLAGTGVLLKGGAVLERLAEVRAFAFDKTGTLTEGRLELGDLLPHGEFSPMQILEAAAIAEQKSEHPLALLILEEARRRGLALPALDEFAALPGAGVAGKSGGRRYLVGTQRLMDEHGIALDDAVRQILHRLDSDGQTALLVSRDGIILGAVGARDRIRPDAAGVIAGLRELGVEEIAILTGDRAAVAEAVGRMTGVSEVHAGLLPEQKAQFVERWQKEKPWAMVGDGINDGLSLVRARVGLAIAGTSSDLAAEAGDIILMGEPLRPLALLLRLSRETVRVIRQNIFVFAFGVNIAGVVLTAWLWPLLAPSAAWYEQSPIAAVIYHQIGSLAVLLNSMRLLWFERQKREQTPSSAGTALHRLDRWFEQTFDLHALSHWLVDHRRSVATVLTGLVVCCYGLSGVCAIGPDEVAVVSRFGRPCADLGPGLHIRFPWPVEEIQRLQPARVESVEIGFRSQGSRPTANLDWASVHSAAGLQRLADEAVMVTGDGNLVELQATVHYVIADPRAFLFGAREPEQVIRAATEAALREAVAGEQFVKLLTLDRQRLQDRTLARIRALCSIYGNVGIRLEDLALHDLHPPQAVVPAYHDVARAMEARERQINEAHAGAIRKKRLTQAEALQVVRKAETAKYEKVSQAAATGSAFHFRQGVRRQLGWRQESRLLGEALLTSWRGLPASSVAADYSRRREEMRALQTTLTDFRLFWTALGKALAGREKVIIDADRVPGKRQLLLIDPGQWRIPSPLLTPSERAPRSGRAARPQEEGK